MWHRGAEEPGTGVSKLVWPVNYIPGAVCVAFCGRPLDGEAAVLPGTAWPQNSGARNALMSTRRKEHPGEGREEGRRKETSTPWVRKGKQCQDSGSGFSFGC